MRGMLVFLMLLTAAGCASRARHDVAAFQRGLPETSGHVLKPEALQDGGRLVVIPFRAGEGVESSVKEDRLALRIIKGMADVFTDKNAPFEILTANDADLATLKMEGFIEGFRQPGFFGRWFGPKEVTITIKAQLFTVSTNERVLFYTARKSFPVKWGSPSDLAYSMGRDLAGFLIASRQKHLR